MMEEYDYDINELKAAGKVSALAMGHARVLAKPGAKLEDVAQGIEKFIKDSGCDMAFPVNLSTDSEAAHYTPEHGDARVIGENDVIKVDLGARKNTNLTDCAFTLSLNNKYSKLVEASEEALENALSMVKSGRPVCDIGGEIEKTARKHGFNPIKNLGGHGISGEDLHAGKFIPNFNNGDSTQLKEGELIAIEPFVTTGVGQVTDGSTTQIYQIISTRMPRSQEARQVLEFCTGNYSTYPFALRWLISGMKISEFMIRKSISELITIGDIEAFPVLVEKSKGIVAQSEKTVIVGSEGCTVIT